MTPKRYFAFGCLTVLIQGGVLASQNSEPNIQLSAGSAMGSSQAVTVSIAMQASQAVEKVQAKAEAAKKPQKSIQTTKAKPVVKPAAKPVAKTQAKLAAKPKADKPIATAKKTTTEPKQKLPLQPTDLIAHNQLQVDARQGVSKQAVSLSKPTFSAPPTQPHYPKKARKRGFQGTATIEVMFNQVGKQLSLTLVDSSGYRLLDKAALNAVEKWQFSAPSPQTAYAYTVRVPVKFELN